MLRRLTCLSPLCAIPNLSACAAGGRVGAERLPEPSAVSGAIRALTDSVYFARIGWVWAAPDGSCWLQYRTYNWYSAIRRIGLDGRVTFDDIRVPERVRTTYPLNELPGGDLLLQCVLASHGDPPPEALARGSVRNHDFRWYETSRLPYASLTTLIDAGDIAHVFGREPYSPYASYLRYVVSDDSISESARTVFRDSAAWIGSDRFVSKRLPGGAPWGIGRYTEVQWDGSSIVVGATTTGWSSLTPEVFRFRVPDCSLLARTDFEPAKTAHYKVLGLKLESAHIVRSGRNYWLFAPSTDTAPTGNGGLQHVYSCLLDSGLRPVQSATITELTALPFEEAPPGSQVEVSLKETPTSPQVRVTDNSELTLRFVAFAPNGLVYVSERRDSIIRDRLTEGGSLPVVEGGDSVGPVTVKVPLYPRAALLAGIEGQTVVTVSVHSPGDVDSVWTSRNSGNWSLDAAAVRAARETRFTGSAFGEGHRLACDLTYNFTRTGPDDRPTVRVVEARLRRIQ